MTKKKRIFEHGTYTPSIPLKLTEVASWVKLRDNIYEVLSNNCQTFALDLVFRFTD